MPVKSKLSKIFSDNDKPKVVGEQFIVNSRSIVALNLKKLGSSPTVTNAIIVYPDKISLGNNVALNYHVWLNGAGGIEIGDDVIIGPYTVIHSANHNFQRTDVPIRTQGHTYKKVIIEDDVWIGAHSLILPGSHIEKGCVIGAGAIITKKIPQNSIVIKANEIVGKRGESIESES